MAGSLTVLSAHRFGRAKEELQTAELLLKNANFRSSINRSYYSIFHAIRAVNALDGFDSSKHSGVIAHFNQEYVKTGVFEKGASKIIRNASELREQADYGDCISKEVLTKVLNYLWLNEHNKMLTLLLRLMQNDLNSVGEKAAKYIATLISIEDYSLLLSENPRVSVVMIRFNWRLALCNDIWKQSKNIQIEVLHELRSTVCKNELVESEYLDIIREALINCKYDLTVEMYKTFGDVVIDVFFELGNSVNKSTNASLKRWSGLCAKNQRLSVSKLTRIEDATLFEVVIDVLDPYDDDLLQVAPTVWEQLYQKFCGISAAYSVRIKYAQFVLPIILRSDNCFADELVRFAFTTVHKILANDNMDYCRWEKLSELLPDVVWYNSWDKCKRLRKAARRKQYDVDFYA